MSLDLENIVLPEHIAIIMDGNGRWAQKNHLPRQAGHKRGADAFRTIAKYCESLGIRALTVYAFSTENWSRSENEVGYLMKLFKDMIDEAFATESNSRVRFIGERDNLSPNLLKLMDKLEKDSSANTGMVLNVALNYGGRAEIVSAAKRIYKDIGDGLLSIEDVSQETFSKYTYTNDIPDPDFILRPSGEKRLSNFLLWQCAYSEFIYMDVLWPDFTCEMLDEAIIEFNKRNRRFGGR